LTEYAEVNIRYQAVTDIGKMDLVNKLTALLAKLLAVIAGSSLQGSTRWRVGMLTDMAVANNVSAVLAIIRLEAILN